MTGMRSTLCFVGAILLCLAFAGNGQAQVVQLLSTGNADADTAIQSTLQGFGYTVDIGPQYPIFDGSTLPGYDVVILVPSYNQAAGDMPAAGQSALKDFVTAGHGLVTGEWTVWKRGAALQFMTLNDAIPAVGSGFTFNSSIIYSQMTPDDVLNAGVDPMFTFPADSVGGTETLFSAKAGATPFYSSDSGGAGVVGWNFGMGRAISFSTLVGPLEMGDSNYGKLVANAVSWSVAPH